MSDSDRTIDSDEFEEMLKNSQASEISDKDKSHIKKHKGVASKQLSVNSTKLHEISDSESSDDGHISIKDNSAARKRQLTEFDSEPIQSKQAKRKPNLHEIKKQIRQSTGAKSLCRYGSQCYRKNPEHLKQFYHPSDNEPDASDPPNISEKEELQQCSKSHTLKTSVDYALSLYLTKVTGIDSKFNNTMAMDIKDILSPSNGKIKASAQFNYMIDIPWLIQQYPKEFRTCPLLIVHGEQRDAKQRLEKSAQPYSNISFCQAKLEILYGTHHTKMMLLLYEKGLRVVIHTSNLVAGDWYQKTQGIWISPVFPPLKEPSLLKGESQTHFKADLIEYLSAYGNKSLLEWCGHIRAHDLSEAKVYLIGSVPGRHTETKKTAFGHLKLRKVLSSNGPDKGMLTNLWPVIGQFSSIGSLGNNEDQWLCGEWLSSLSSVKGSGFPVKGTPLKLVYPSVDNVRMSLEGYPAGASLPYSYKVAIKQPYLRNFWHQWKSESRGRSRASPHIKTYVRISPDMKMCSWFLVTSANLSKAAWGALEKKGTQLMIRSYELGVLFLPKSFGSFEYFSINSEKSNKTLPLLLPYDVPLTPYENSDQPWTWDIPHVHAPDCYGNKWCPTLK